MRAAINRFFLRFARDTHGSITVEFVLMAPMMFWAVMASYVYFDGYRQSALNLKAAYTVSDLISRETAAINNDYIDSMYNVLELMVRPDSTMKMRISVVRYDQADDRYYVDWSKARGYTTVRTDDNVMDIKTKLPVMPDGERVILVETDNTYVPLFNVGLGDKELDNFVFTRPRFAPLVAWSDT